MKKTFDFIKNRKIALIIAGCFILAGIVLNVIFGATLSIDFKGGTIVKYSYSGELDKAKVDSIAEDTLGGDVRVELTSDYTGDTKIVSITLAADKAVATETISALDEAMDETFADNKVENISTTSVNASMGKGFFIKCIFATVLGAIFIVLYVGIRFRKIGGVSAAVCALLCLVHDIVISYFVYVVCRFPIDSNFIAVLLVLFGYSLNGTIVVYDRIRENRKKFGKDQNIDSIVNMSINQTVTRNIFTSITTVVALITICIVAWFNNVSSIISFVFPMTIGIVAGCFSSVCLSSPIWAWWRNMNGDPAEKKKARRAARIEKKAAAARKKKKAR